MTASESIVSVSGLCKRFGKIEALVDLDLDIPKASRFGLLGPNGAGKTTAIRILSGLLRPTRGNATVCGFDIHSQRTEIKRVTGYLPESPGLYSKLSAVEFLEFIGALYDMERNVLMKRIDRFLSILGLEGRQDDQLESYSAGMKQKVLVASTLLHEPRLVFLDEPTSHLDPAASSLVKEIIRALSEETKTTFFMCTHLTDLAEDLCDIIGILSNGQLLTIGPPEDMINKTGARNLEEAYLKLVGDKIPREDLLDWRL